MARFWYCYLGSGSTTDPANYMLHEGTPECLAGNTICAVLAPAGALFPQAPFSTNIQVYIINASSTNVPQPNLPGAKYYLYKKNT